MPHILEDSTSSLELSAFKEKLRLLYNQILEKVYKRENPGASPEEVQAYVEENGLQFPDEVEDAQEQDEEIEELMNMLDTLVPSDESELASEMDMEKKPKEHTGLELKSKSHEKGLKIEMKDLKDKMGGLFDIKTDKRKRTATRAPKIATGTIKRNTNTAHQVEFAPLIEKFRDELKSLSDRQKIGRKKLIGRL
jgi:hypothetical protein|tara:strand:- start:3 stop:584 length:582 start_codon:yes stop_codon:yes gene_type:complete